jgi:hypothetical protein
LKQWREGNFENAFSWKPKTVLKWFGKDMMHQIHVLTLSVRDHLSGHGMALDFSWLGYPVPRVSHIQNSFYSLHSNNKKHKKHNKHKILAIKQHYKQLHTIAGKILKSSHFWLSENPGCYKRGKKACVLLPASCSDEASLDLILEKQEAD